MFPPMPTNSPAQPSLPAFFLFFSAVCLPSQCTWQYLPAFILFWHGFPARVRPWQSSEKDKVSQGSSVDLTVDALSYPVPSFSAPDIFAGRLLFQCNGIILSRGLVRRRAVVFSPDSFAGCLLFRFSGTRGILYQSQHTV